MKFKFSKENCFQLHDSVTSFFCFSKKQSGSDLFLWSVRLRQYSSYGANEMHTSNYNNNFVHNDVTIKKKKKKKKRKERKKKNHLQKKS